MRSIKWRWEFLSSFFFDEVILKEDIHFLSIQNCQFRHCTFDQVNFEQVRFANCTFINCKFLTTSFFECVMERNKVEDCDFLESMILISVLRDVVFSVSQFERSELKSSFQDSNFSTSILKDTYLDLTNLKNCILTPSQGLELLLFYGISFSE